MDWGSSDGWHWDWIAVAAAGVVVTVDAIATAGRTTGVAAAVEARSGSDWWEKSMD